MDLMKDTGFIEVTLEYDDNYSTRTEDENSITLDYDVHSDSFGITTYSYD